jgi:hypothetical protein
MMALMSILLKGAGVGYIGYFTASLLFQTLMDVFKSDKPPIDALFDKLTTKVIYAGIGKLVGFLGGELWDWAKETLFSDSEIDVLDSVADVGVTSLKGEFNSNEITGIVSLVKREAGLDRFEVEELKSILKSGDTEKLKDFVSDIDIDEKEFGKIVDKVESSDYLYNKASVEIPDGSGNAIEILSDMGYKEGDKVNFFELAKTWYQKNVPNYEESGGDDFLKQKFAEKIQALDNQETKDFFDKIITDPNHKVEIRFAKLNGDYGQFLNSDPPVCYIASDANFDHPSKVFDTLSHEVLHGHQEYLMKTVGDIMTDYEETAKERVNDIKRKLWPSLEEYLKEVKAELEADKFDPEDIPDFIEMEKEEYFNTNIKPHLLDVRKEITSEYKDKIRNVLESEGFDDVDKYFKGNKYKFSLDNKLNLRQNISPTDKLGNTVDKVDALGFSSSDDYIAKKFSELSEIEIPEEFKEPLGKILRDYDMDDVPKHLNSYFSDVDTNLSKDEVDSISKEIINYITNNREDIDKFKLWSKFDVAYTGQYAELDPRLSAIHRSFVKEFGMKDGWINPGDTEKAKKALEWFLNPKNPPYKSPEFGKYVKELNILMRSIPDKMEDLIVDKLTRRLTQLVKTEAPGIIPKDEALPDIDPNTYSSPELADKIANMKLIAENYKSIARQLFI